MRRLALALPLLAACTRDGDTDPCAGAASMDTPTATPVAASCQDQVQIERDTSDLINEYRDSKCLVSLVLDPCISEIARQHSQDMATGAVGFGHDGFDQRASDIQALLPSTIIVGENVAFNQGYDDPAQASYEGWLNSPPHLENIETPEYNLTGMGVVEDSSGGYWFTQLFVGATE